MLRLSSEGKKTVHQLLCFMVLAVTTSTAQNANTNLRAPNTNTRLPNTNANDRQQCLSRSCSNVVSARPIRYPNALQMTANKGYRRAVGLSDVRRSSRFFHEYEYDIFNEEDSYILSREKRQDYCSAAYGLKVLAGATLAAILVSFYPLLYALQQPVLPPQPVLLQPRPPPEITVQPPQGEAPADQPQPGTPGGGNLPVASSPDAAEALALVPPGLVAVAVFTPFSDPSTVNASCVIFSEADETSIAGELQEVRRESMSWQGASSFQNVPRSFQRSLVKDRYDSSNQVQREVIVVERLYGIRCLVKWTEQCFIGTTCDEQGNEIGSGFAITKDSLFARRQSADGLKKCSGQFARC